MTWSKTRSIAVSIFTVSIILIASSAIIAYGRGYRLNLDKPTQLSPTGIVTATSDPVAAQVLVDTKLKTATNNSFNLDPGWYTLRIVKEGYQGWEKKLRVQGEVVVRADAYLFPTSPSLSPITTSGILAPVVSPDGTMIAFIVPVEAARDGIKKPGLYTLALADRSLGGRNRDPKLVAEGSFTAATRLQWSPDGTKILVSAGMTGTLYDLTKTPAAITPAGETADWPEEAAGRDRQKLAAFKQPFIDVATSSARILSFSPDETKLLYEATASATIPPVIDPPLIGTNPTEETRAISPGNLYVYDSREDRNYFVEEASKLRSIAASKKPQNEVTKLLSSPSSPYPIFWLPTSRHLILVGNTRLPSPAAQAAGGQEKIDVMEYDRTNWITLYAGPFDETFLTPWPTGGRLVILTNLNPGASTLPNLYTVNLR